MLIIDRFQHYSTLRLFRFHPLFTRVFGWKRAFEARIRGKIIANLWYCAM